MTTLSLSKLTAILSQRSLTIRTMYGVEGRVRVMGLSHGTAFLLMTIPSGYSLPSESVTPLIEASVFSPPAILGKWQASLSPRLGMVSSLAMYLPSMTYLLPEGSGLDSLHSVARSHRIRMSPGTAEVILADPSGKVVPSELITMSESLTSDDLASLSLPSFPPRDGGQIIGVPVLVYTLDELLAETRTEEKRKTFLSDWSTLCGRLTEEVLTARTDWAERVDRKLKAVSEEAAEKMARALTAAVLPVSFDAVLEGIEKDIASIRKRLKTLHSS